MRQISKTQIIDFPTKVSEFTNDSGFVTKSVNNLDNYYTESETDALLGNKQDKNFTVYSELTVGELIANEGSVTSNSLKTKLGYLREHSEYPVLIGNSTSYALLIIDYASSNFDAHCYITDSTVPLHIQLHADGNNNWTITVSRLYILASTGIPSTDLASGVQTTLTNANADHQLIPAQASSENQLADKAFVNSSIATATATYRESWHVVGDLELAYNASNSAIAAALDSKIATADNNDYCFVQIPASGTDLGTIVAVRRFKHNGTNWAYEYTLNNSGFTAAQWAAINSTITSGLVSKLTDLPTAVQLESALNGKQNVINDLATIRSGASAGATAYHLPPSGIPATDLQNFQLFTNVNTYDLIINEGTVTDTSLKAKLDAIRAATNDNVLILISDAGGIAPIITDGNGSIYSSVCYAVSNGDPKYIILESDQSDNWTITVSDIYLKPSTGIPASDMASGVIPDISGKADKVSGATNGHLAGLNANGELTDSGVVAADVVTSSSVRTVVLITQSDYDALATKDANTEYNIIEQV